MRPDFRTAPRTISRSRSSRRERSRIRPIVAAVVTPLESRTLLTTPPYAALTRAEARDYYLDVFEPMADVAPSWTGNVETGDAGTLGAEYIGAILDRFNAFRYMAGLPDDVTLDATFNQRAQQAALMMSANKALSHAPPPTWKFYTEDGRIGAGASNLHQLAGPQAIDGYVTEGAPAGHRRWILFPPTERIGIGDIPTPTGGYPEANATYVIGGFGTRPNVPFVAWPPAGFVPYKLVSDAWSFAVGGGTDFSSATVAVKSGGNDVPVTIRSRGLGFGDPAIEWTVPVDRTRPSADATYDVDVKHVGIGGGQFQDFHYSFTIFDPTPTWFQFFKDWNWSYENSGPAMFDVDRKGDTSTAVTVKYAAVNDTAQAGLDYTAAVGTLQFAAGETRKTISVPLLNDGVDTTYWEGFRVVLSQPTRGTELGAPSSSAWTIGDNDGVHAWLNFKVTAVTVAETAGSVTLEVVRGGDSTNSDISVSYATTDGTAKAGSDYTAATGTLRFAPGVLSRTITIPITNNVFFEPTEAFTITLSNPTGGAHLGEYTPAAATAVVTITDDDPAVPVLEFGQATVSVVEGKGTVTLQVVRNTIAPDADVTVSYATVAGTALAGSDFTTTSGVLHFAAGQFVGTIVVPILDDKQHETSESFTVVLSHPNGAVVGPVSTATVTIEDEDPLPPSLAFTQASATVDETAGTVTVDVVRSGDPNADVSVSYATVDATALAGSDYDTTSGILHFAPGTISRTIVVPIRDDDEFEGDETFSLVLSDPTNGAGLGAITSATITIVSEDPPPATLSFVFSTAAVSESAGSVTIQVTRGGDPNAEVSVSYATADGTALAGSDYSAATGTLNFAAGVLSRTIVVPILDDSVVENGKEFSVVLSQPVGGVLGATTLLTVTILNDDLPPPAIALSQAALTVSEAAGQAILTVSRLGNLSVEATVSYTTAAGTAQAGSDFTSASGIVHFAAGEFNRTIVIPIRDDGDHETSESFTVVLSDPNGAVLGGVTTATVTIQDNDPVPTVLSFLRTIVTVGEGGGPAVVEASRDGDIANELTVPYTLADGTARSGVDYVGTGGTLRFAPGQRTQRIEVPIVDDGNVESDETFTVSLGNAGSATVTIVDNDSAAVSSSLEFAQAAVSVTESVGQVVLEVRRRGDTTGEATVTYGTVAGSALDGTDFVTTQGVLRFAAGETSQTIRVPIRDDRDSEPSETFSVVLTDPATGATLGTSRTAVVTVVDDDPLPPRIVSVSGIRTKAGLGQVVLEASSGLDPVGAATKSAYILRRAGRDKKFGTRDDTVLRFSSAVYDPTHRRVTLKLAKAFKPREKVQLTASAIFLRSPNGPALDGNGDGKAGDNAALTFRS